MDQRQGYTADSLRFTRWSRSRSAVFHSLSRSVSIGHLSVSVLRLLERKTETISSFRRGQGTKSISFCDEEDDGNLFGWWDRGFDPLFLLSLLSYTQDEGFAQTPSPYIQVGGEAWYALSSRQDQLDPGETIFL